MSRKGPPATVIRYGFLDLAGRIAVAPRFDAAGDFSEGLAAARQGEQWGYIDKTGAWAISAQFRKAGPFRGGEAVVTLASDEGAVIDPTGRKSAAATAREKQSEKEALEAARSPPLMETYHAFAGYSEGIALAVTHDGYIIGLDPDGQRLFDIDAPDGGQEIHHYSDGFACVGMLLDEMGKKVKRWNYVDRTGKLLLAEPVEWAGDFHDGAAHIRRGSRWQVIDRAGRTIIAREDLATIAPHDADGDFRVSTSDGLYGLVDRHARWLLPPRFARLLDFCDGGAIASEPDSEGELWGVVDKRGRWRLLPVYRHIRIGDDGVATATKVGRFRHARHRQNPYPRFGEEFRNPHWWIDGDWELLDRNGALLVEIGPRPTPPGVLRDGLVRFGHQFNLLRRRTPPPRVPVFRTASAGRAPALPGASVISGDGRWRFHGDLRAVYRTDQASGASAFVLEGLPDRPGSLAIAGDLLALVSSDRLGFVPLANPAHARWQQCGFRTTVRAALGGRAIIVGPGLDSSPKAIGVLGERHEQLGALNATADAFLFSAPPSSPDEEIAGLAAAWEAVFGLFGDDASTLEQRRRREADSVAHDRLVEQARARGQIALRPIVAPPRPPIPAGIDIGALYCPWSGSDLYVAGLQYCFERGANWAVAMADARGTVRITGAVGQGGIRHPLFESAIIWRAYHPDGSRFLVARRRLRSDEVAEVDVERRTWRSLAHFNEELRGIAYLDGGIAVLFKDSVRGFHRNEATGALEERWRLPIDPSTDPRKEFLYSTARDEVMLVCGPGRPSFVLGAKRGEVRFLGAHQGQNIAPSVWTDRGRLVAQLEPRDQVGIFFELANLEQAHARAFAAPAAPAERLDGAAAAVAPILSLLPS